MTTATHTHPVRIIVSVAAFIVAVVLALFGTLVLTGMSQNPGTGADLNNAIALVIGFGGALLLTGLGFFNLKR